MAMQAARLTLVQVLINSKGLQMNPLQSLYYVSPACLICLSVPFSKPCATEQLCGPVYRIIYQRSEKNQVLEDTRISCHDQRLMTCRCCNMKVQYAAAVALELGPLLHDTTVKIIPSVMLANALAALALNLVGFSCLLQHATYSPAAC
jgi:hypothetical protein